MSFQAFQQNFPQTAFVNPQTGHLTTDGRLLLTTMHQRQGGGTGIIPVVKQALAATGATQADAHTLTADWNDVQTVPTGSGVAIPTMKPGNDITIRNSGANALNVYPFSGAQIDTHAVNAPISMPPNTTMTLRCWSTTLLRST
jgi:hypothetical protein